MNEIQNNIFISIEYSKRSMNREVYSNTLIHQKIERFQSTDVPHGLSKAITKKCKIILRKYKRSGRNKGNWSENTKEQ